MGPLTGPHSACQRAPHTRHTCVPRGRQLVVVLLAPQAPGRNPPTDQQSCLPTSTAAHQAAHRVATLGDCRLLSQQPQHVRHTQARSRERWNQRVLMYAQQAAALVGVANDTRPGGHTASQEQHRALGMLDTLTHRETTRQASQLCRACLPLPAPHAHMAAGISTPCTEHCWHCMFML